MRQGADASFFVELTRQRDAAGFGDPFARAGGVSFVTQAWA
jgi:hypothetical protein